MLIFLFQLAAAKLLFNKPTGVSCVYRPGGSVYMGGYLQGV